ncbi:AAA family ATPase [Xylophilus sp. GOD-11R]|uniref:AAA family ATPase n=1 Tax=Xylophilus sp. GOD-11R TaxID=3089814 RepID=UPI00298D2F37|nr:AAA family ATPase [Xylophilus sp. GOD-11R]WPB57105.1 AAA family ATPase [Xylophilus sp. GOD-11R]
MYASAFGLQQAPFSIAPDPRYLFMSERHREALAHLLFGLGAGGGFVLLTGEIGTGKTTVCRCFLEQLPDNCDVAYVFNPKQSAMELLRTINDEFGVKHAPAEPGVGETVKDCIDPLNAFLLQSHAAGRNAVLVVDEAQNLSVDVLEQLRLLTNLETSERKLLQIVLIGQPELRDMLARPELEQLAQRVVARFHLDALSPPEVEAYMAHRLAIAGWTGPPPFDRRLLRRVHQITGGVPRRINLLCDRALLGAYAAGARTVDRRMLERAAREVFHRTATTGADAARGRRRTPLAGVAAGIVIGGALVSAAAFAVWTNRPAAARAVIAPVTPAVPHPAAAPAAAPAQAPSPPVAEAPTPAPAPEPAAQIDPAEAPFDLAEALPRLSDSEDAALRRLAAEWGTTVPATGKACTALARTELRCFRAPRAGLDLIRQMDRPALLPLDISVDGVRRQVFVLVRGLDADRVELDFEGQTHRVATAELSRWWHGDAVTLWRTPDTGTAGLDARLATAMPDLPARLSRAERISRFQLAQGLPPDGVAGPLTAMRLNRATGVDEPRLQRH